MIDNEQVLETVTSLQDLLISRATGGHGSENRYADFREDLLGIPEIQPLIPSFLRTKRNLTQFWSYIQRNRGSYEERKKHIWTAFTPLINYLEEDAQATPGGRISPRAGRSGIHAFISYASRDQEAAAVVKKALGAFSIESFLAYSDIEATEEWVGRLREELAGCDVFVPLLSEAFRKSEWGSQEIGAAALRPGVFILPLQLDATPPYGFIAHLQGLRVTGSAISPETIVAPLAREFPRVVIPKMIDRVREAKSYERAQTAMKPLVEHFGRLTRDELRALLRASIDNGQVWAAEECRDTYLPRLIDLNRERIPAADLRKLEYQLENQAWYSTRKAKR